MSQIQQEVNENSQGASIHIARLETEPHRREFAAISPNIVSKTRQGVIIFFIVASNMVQVRQYSSLSKSTDFDSRPDDFQHGGTCRWP